MIKRRLAALGYEGSVDIDNEKSAKELLTWLESEKIRHFPEKERNKLTERWPEGFETYLRSLQCPLEQFSTIQDRITWLLSLAIKEEFKNKGHKLKNSSKELSHETVTDQKSMIDELDLHTPQCKKGIEDLASSLGIVRHPENHLITLRACCKFIVAHMDKTRSKVGRDEDVTIELKNHPMGLNKDLDPVVASCAKTLRLLHVGGLRELQNKINQIIVEIQAITADPKTDTSLGKVGR